MPVKNAGIFLEECLNSVLNQSYSNWELIAVNDHSTDNSFTILNQYARQDHRIKVFENEGSGIIDALRTSYKNSKGSFITRMDADDVMSIGKLEGLIHCFKEKRSGIVATGTVEYIENEFLNAGFKRYAKWLNKLTLNNENYNEIYKECVIPSPCWMVNRKDFELAGAFSSNVYPEDYDLVFRFYESGLRIKGVRETLHYWRDHPQRASRIDPNYYDQLFFKMKWRYFKRLDLNENKELVIWGAGKKAKEFVKIIQEDAVKFRWVCNNKKKFGKHIYRVKIEDGLKLKNLANKQFIILVSSKNDQFQVREYLNSFKLKPGKHYFIFC